MTAIDFLKNPKTVQIIKASLNQKVTLPSEGFVAGGSVANMLLSLYYKGTPWFFQLNDVDIFRDVSEDLMVGKKHIDDITVGENLLSETIMLNKNMSIYEDYGRNYVEFDGTFYKVLNSERDGLINNVTCYVSRGNGGSVTARVTPEPPVENPGQIMISQTRRTPKIKNGDHPNDIILRGFDINSCQAGIDLSTDTLHYTEDFLEFLDSREVLISVPYSPLQTSIRLFKKMKQYDGICYTDMDRELEYLYHASLLSDSNQYIGIETYHKFMDNQEHLSSYLQLKPLSWNSIPIKYRDRYGVDGELPEDKKLWSFMFIKEFEDLPYTFDYVWGLKKYWDFTRRNLSNKSLKKINTILEFGDSIDEHWSMLSDYMQAHPGSYEVKYSFPLQCLMIKSDYFNCDFTKTHLKTINQVVTNHWGLIPILSKCCNVQKQHDSIKNIKSFVKKEGEWVYGILETKGKKIHLPDGVVTKELLQKMVDDEKKRMETELIEGVDLSDFKHNRYVKELLTPLDLKKEGDKMGHCVGGYSSSIENKDSRIFNIQVNGIHSTLEVRYVYDEGLLHSYPGDKSHLKYIKLSQHYGNYPVVKGNATPPNKNRGVAFKLIHFLNKKLLKEVKFTKKMFNDYHKGKNNKNPKKVKKQPSYDDWFDAFPL